MSSENQCWPQIFPGLGWTCSSNTVKRKSSKGEILWCLGQAVTHERLCSKKAGLGNSRKFELFQESKSFIVGYSISLDRMGAWEQTAAAVAVWPPRVIPGQSKHSHCFSRAPCSGGREGKMFYICCHFESQRMCLINSLCCAASSAKILLVTAANLHMWTWLRGCADEAHNISRVGTVLGWYDRPSTLEINLNC